MRPYQRAFTRSLSSSIALVALFGVSPLDASGQDVEMLGRRYGTRPPQAYYDERIRDPIAFEYTRGRSQRLRLTTQLQPGVRGFSPRGPSLALGPRNGPVVGTYRVPVLLGLYENSGFPPPFTRDSIATGYFGAQAGTITHYYDEVSGGRVSLLGDVYEWIRISQPDSIITDGQSGLFGAPLGGGGSGNYVYEVVSLQSGIDWGDYDNDGPDGVPNSGDDDGFVDVVAVIQPTRGGECGGPGSGDRIWSHRWSLSQALQAVYETATPSASGGFIKVDDYTVQPSYSCGGSQLSQIGVFTHELGHAFGLPDLYDTNGSDGSHAGAGIWDLMSSGSWGCNNGSPSSPCHLGAWSKEQLGWANVVTLAPDTDHGVLTLPPVESDGTIYRVDANDGSGEYFLLENRQRIGYDQSLYSEGLLIWQIDPDWVSTFWPENKVNGFDHRGVWLRQADGLDELGRPGGGRGDASDPFPGQTGNDAFHAVTVPAATSYQGGPTGVTLVGIAQSGDDVQFRLSTRFTAVTVRADGAASPEGLFTVDGVQVDPPETTLLSAPFLEHEVEAIAGEAVAPGERRPFLEWSDAPGEARLRTITTPLQDIELVARYGGSQYHLDLGTTGGVGGIEPGSFVTTPPSEDLWFEAGTDVTRLEAVPLTGFGFLGWTGELAGAPNPTSVTMSSPVVAGADFELLYAVTTTPIDLVATLAQDLQLEATNGTAPYTWRVVGGTLPWGLNVSGTGRITGASIDLGSFPVTLEAVDANGLPAVGEIVLEIGSPEISIEALVSPFLLSGPPLSGVQLNFLNRQGNGVAGYDIGDFRAWVLGNPTMPMSASFGAAPVPRTIVVPMRTEETGGRR